LTITPSLILPHQGGGYKKEKLSHQGGGYKEKKLLHQGQNIFMVKKINFLYNVHSIETACNFKPKSGEESGVFRNASDSQSDDVVRSF